MTGGVAKRRLPRSYREGRLLRLLAADMIGHSMEQRGPAAARFVPAGAGPVVEVTERVDRRLLGHSEIARFETRSPLATPVTAKLAIHHSGRWTREGIEVRVSDGDETGAGLAHAIEADRGFVGAVLPLDFTLFEVSAAAGDCRSTVELMGATFVSVALPPMRSYVRLYPDQRQALIGSLTALGDVIRRFGRSAP